MLCCRITTFLREFGWFVRLKSQASTTFFVCCRPVRTISSLYMCWWLSSINSIPANQKLVFRAHMIWDERTIEQQWKKKYTHTHTLIIRQAISTSHSNNDDTSTQTRQYCTQMHAICVIPTKYAYSRIVQPEPNEVCCILVYISLFVCVCLVTIYGGLFSSILKWYGQFIRHIS